MTLDTGETHAESALTFVHEMNHAHYHHAKLEANIATMTKVAYVNAAVAEEVEGTVLSIEAKSEMKVTQASNHTAAKAAAAKSTDPAVRGKAIPAPTPITATFPLGAEYNAAYQAKIRAGKSQAEARTAGRARVRKGFDDGEVKTSNTNQKYADYYGASWDAAHPPARR